MTIKITQTENTYKKIWESSASGEFRVEDFLSKIGEPSDTIVVVEEKGIIDVYNDSNGYIYVDLNEGEE
mgnify:CR=1 FL=1